MGGAVHGAVHGLWDCGVAGQQWRPISATTTATATAGGDGGEGVMYSRCPGWAPPVVAAGCFIKLLQAGSIEPWAVPCLDGPAGAAPHPACLCLCLRCPCAPTHPPTGGFIKLQALNPKP